MAKHRLCLRASVMLPLMALFQVQQTAASPVRRILHNRAETVTTTDCPPEQRHSPPAPRSLEDVGYSTTVQPSSNAADGNWHPPQAIAWQIEDGQVQAYSLLAEDAPVTSDGLVVPSGTTVTPYNTYTPLPRAWTPPSGSDRSHWISETQSHSWDWTSTDRPRNDGDRPNEWRQSDVPQDTIIQGGASSSFQRITSVSSSTSTAFVAPTPFSTPALPSSTTATDAFAATSTPSSTSSSPPASSGPPVSSVPDVFLTSLSVSEVQTVTEAPPSSTSGVILSGLETSGNPATQPFPSLSPNTTRSLSLVDTATLGSIGPTATAGVTAISADDIFQPIASDAPPAQITQRDDHPVARLGVQQQQQRLQTNKFYANLFLGDQTNPLWTHPYSLAWSGGGGQSKSYGMAISHIERDQIPGGPADGSDRAEWGFFAAPLGIQSLVLSAVELVAGTTLTTDSLEAFSVNANLVAPGGSVPVISLPMVQGMAFVTASYNSGTPLIETGLGFENLTYAGSIQNGATYKYQVLLTGGFTWLMYVTPSSEKYSQNSFTLLNPTTIQGPSAFGGTIQVAKIPANEPNAENIYDSSAGAYATGATIAGSVQGTAGTYTISWNRAGVANQNVLMFALPHHLESFAYDTVGGVTEVQLITTTKGMATAVRGEYWTLTEPDLPITMSFNPWSPTNGDISTLPQEAVDAINIAGDAELRESVANQSNGGSMYYDGKALAKFAAIVYVLHELADNVTLALTGLQQLQSAFDIHISNRQTFPLVYDTQWGGVVSVSTYLTGNNGDDFGNTYYNDHHFHYEYFVYAAAIIGYLDPAWLEQGTNRAWVNALTRDYANPTSNDPYYPFSRNFDWYNGHSWAKGLFPSADGKDQESSSEDTMASYAIKMWGRTTNDQNMEARGNLMLSIQARSLRQYYLYTDDNTAQPPQYIGNRVAGILFDNKCDHTTYFGNNIEYIQGIHMLPLLPMSTLIRSPAFVQQEWDAYDLAAYAPSVQGGWRGVLMANLAIVDPRASYAFFSNASGDFSLDLLDGGASQTWYLAWSAALRGDA